MAITKSAKQLVAEANAVIDQVDPAHLISGSDDDYIVVDIRDVRELDREGMIPEALHAPRGMLEFWVDPSSPYHRDVFARNDKTYLLYCQSAWRSALASKSLYDMGMTNIKHLAGGFTAWKQAGGTIAERPKNTKTNKE